jgi:ADP-ribose pyrophosphatase YjhB (NUDIX family)
MLSKRYLDDEERDRLVCEACGHIHYVNPTVVAGTVPAVEDRIWLLRRGIEPRLGAWSFPAGYMEMNETVEEAAMRETLEELNITVRITGLLGVYSRREMSTVHVVYLADALAVPTGGKETLEFALFAPDEIPWDELAFRTTHMALQDWLALTHR